MRALRRLPRGAEGRCVCKGRSRPTGGRLRSRRRRSAGGGSCRSPRRPFASRVDEPRGAAREEALGKGASEGKGRRRLLRRERGRVLGQGRAHFIFQTLAPVEREYAAHELQRASLPFTLEE